MVDCVHADAPQEFWDALPDYHEVPLPADPWAPVGMPIVAWHPYADVGGMDESPSFNGTVNMTRLHVYRKSYYASISYVGVSDNQLPFLCCRVHMTTRLNVLRAIAICRGQTDYNIGQIVKKLDATRDLKMETAVVVFGDHGRRRCSSRSINCALSHHVQIAAIAEHTPPRSQATSWASTRRGARSVTTIIAHLPTMYDVR